MVIPIVFVAMELVVGQFCRVDAQCSDEVEGDRRLLGELIPQL